MNRYVIECVNDTSLLWSNSDGWVEEGFDTFTVEETETLRLPIEGRWIKLTTI